MSPQPTRRRPPAPWVWRLDADQAGTVHEAILGQLRDAVLAGHVPPGTAINVDDIAHRFLVSRIPVREALKTLIGEGLVEHAPRAGYRIAQLTRAELAELYVVREALENAALAVAVSSADAQADAEVDAARHALTVAIARGDARGHHVESRRFHLALTTPAGMARLLRMFESAWNVTEPQQPMSHVPREIVLQLQEDHRALAEAFHARDVPRLLAASSEHYRRLRCVVSGPPGTGLRP